MERASWCGNRVLDKSFLSCFDGVMSGSEVEHTERAVTGERCGHTESSDGLRKLRSARQLQLSREPLPESVAVGCRLPHGVTAQRRMPPSLFLYSSRYRKETPSRRAITGHELSNSDTNKLCHGGDLGTSLSCGERRVQDGRDRRFQGPGQGYLQLSQHRADAKRMMSTQRRERRSSELVSRRTSIQALLRTHSTNCPRDNSPTNNIGRALWATFGVLAERLDGGRVSTRKPERIILVTDSCNEFRRFRREWAAS